MSTIDRQNPWNIPLLLIVAAIALPTAATASAIFAGCALSLIIWLNFGRPVWRSYRMKKPFKAEFVLEREDGIEARVQELVLPAHSDVDVQIRLSPKLHYEEHILKFGFVGPADARPLPLSTQNNFVKSGRVSESPESNGEHMIDKKDIYHLRRKSHRSKGNEYAIGFNVRTRAPGKYAVRFEALTDDGESLPETPLWVVVAAPDNAQTNDAGNLPS